MPIGVGFRSEIRGFEGINKRPACCSSSISDCVERNKIYMYKIINRYSNHRSRDLAVITTFRTYPRDVCTKTITRHAYMVFRQRVCNPFWTESRTIVSFFFIHRFHAQTTAAKTYNRIYYEYFKNISTPEYTTSETSRVTFCDFFIPFIIFLS